MESVIKTGINNVLTELGLSSVDFVVEHPTELSHGDYACNVAMVVAKQLKKNPRVLAEEISAKLEGNITHIGKIEVAGPGFINFYLRRDFFVEKITQIHKQEDSWGKNNSWKGKKVIVEYTDPNPFKEFHIGHLFTNSVGESIARLFTFSGADTKHVCYQGDVGMHVANAIWGLQKMGASAENISVFEMTPKALGQAYAKGATAYKEDESVREEIKVLNKKIYERSDEYINTLYDKGREVSLAYFETVYKVLGTKFDEYFYESEAGPKGKELVLDNPEVFVESDGAKIFEGEKCGLHTRVFLNSEGLPTYEAKELALAKMKEDAFGKYDLSIISTANEITEYFKVLKKAMSFVYPELEKKTEHIGHGTVRLTSGKMSSRTGDVIPALSFIKEIKEAVLNKMKSSADSETDERVAQAVAIAAIKYATLKGSILQDTVFDKEQALSFEGASGPYLQYTYARIVSVLKKAEEAGITMNVESPPGKPYEIEKILYRFPEVVLKAVNERAPHHVTTYLTELASAFNTFYAGEKIADVSDEHAPYKVALAETTAQTLKNGLWILGIEALRQM